MKNIDLGIGKHMDFGIGKILVSGSENIDFGMGKILILGWETYWFFGKRKILTLGSDKHWFLGKEKLNLGVKHYWIFGKGEIDFWEKVKGKIFISGEETYRSWERTFFFWKTSEGSRARASRARASFFFFHGILLWGRHKRLFLSEKQACVRIYIYIYMYIHVCAHTYTSMHIRAHTWTFLYVYIYTQTRVCLPSVSPLALAGCILFFVIFVMATTHIVDADGRRFFSHHVASASALFYQGKKPQISVRSYLV